MQRQRGTRSRRVSIAFILSLAAAASCDDVLGPGGEPQAVAMRLVVGSQTVVVSAAGVTGGPLSLSAGANSLTATFLTAGGQQDPNVTAAEFQLNVEVLGGAPITFQRSAINPFAGTLTVAGSVQGAQLRFTLFHVEAQHADLGPFTVTVSAGS